MGLNRRNWLRSTAMMGTAGMLLPSGFGAMTLPEQGHIPTSDAAPILLNSNENAFGPSQAVIESISHSVSESNRYPWKTRQLLIKKISSKEGIPEDYILLGAGSTEILQLAGLAFGANGGEIASSYPTFPIMMQHANNFNAKWTKVPLDQNLTHDLGALSAAGKQAQLIYICNPNNPTGTMISQGALLDFCKSVSNQTIVFVDEAYIEFTDQGIKASVAELVASVRNLVVARTFSKIYGLAGLRVGYAYAHPEIVSQLKHHHIGFELNIPITSIHAAMAAADDHTFMEKCKGENRRAREMVYSAFDEWGVTYQASHASFIYFKVDRFGQDLVKTLEKHRIFIRDYADQPGFARVSMGTSDQIKEFITTTRQFLVS